MYRQGDVLLIKIDPNLIPAEAKQAKPEHGRLVLAHGEVTGHHHSLAVQEGVELVTLEEADELRMWLSITTIEPIPLEHQEHATILIEPGFYEKRQQREYSPEQIRNVQD